MDDFMEFLLVSPWWVSAALGVTSVLLIESVFREKLAGGIMGSIITPDILALVVGGAFALAAAASAYRSWQRRQQLDTQTSIDSINQLSWKQFEELMGEVYRRQGYAVSENEGVGPDGGVDLVLRKSGATYLVQCKQWRTYSVGVKVIREMLGLVAAHRATGAIVVTSGVFTAEAVAFASKQPVQLVDGHQLIGLVRSVQSAAPGGALAAELPIQAEPAECPRCGREMVLRTAKRGANAGGQFWGCSGYPECRYTESA